MQKQTPITKIPVTLGGEKAYDIKIGTGLLDKIGQEIADLGGIRRAVMISDNNVAALYGQRVLSNIKASGIEISLLTCQAGETAKTWPVLQDLTEALLEKRIDRGTLLIALGGGVVGDLAGFIAAITLRGLDFIQIPTTLLAQVDSAIGGKTAINSSSGKNLIGAFHQPRLVLSDIECLTSLTKRSMLAGYAEIVKHALIADADCFTWLERSAAKLLAGDANLQSQAIAHSCRTKAAIVSADEQENGTRALLNFGHTFAHALETATGHSDRLLHGEAVAIGMILAYQLGSRLNLNGKEEEKRLTAHFAALGLPVRLYDIKGSLPKPAELVTLMETDKKRRDNAFVFVLSPKIGQAKIVSGIDRDVIVEVIRAN